MTPAALDFLPPLPLSLRLHNVLGKGLDALGRRRQRYPLEDLITAACARTGLADFGDEEVLIPLRILLRSLEQDARLHFTGERAIRRTMQMWFERRLHVEADLKRHPEIFKVEIQRPIVILGLPRTGTTFLQTLLSRDPGCRYLRSWELIEPWPRGPHAGEAGKDPRAVQFDQLAAKRVRLFPHIEQQHSFSAPAECRDLFSTSFYSFHFSSFYGLDGYAEWLEERSYGEWLWAYGQYKRQLQRLAWLYPRGRWVLKSPHHLLHIRELVKTLPDACVVMLHRDPQKSVGSLCSHLASMRQLFSEDLDLEKIGAVFLKGMQKDALSAVAARRELPGESFLDVSYHDLVRDPMAVVDRIDAHFQLPREPGSRQAIATWLAQSGREKRPKHEYHLSQFGLSGEEVKAAFAPYRSYFNIPEEVERR